MGRIGKKAARLARVLLPPALAAAALVWFSFAVEGLDQGRGDEDRRQLEHALRRGCTACYAAEGRYPPSLSYLEDRYGIQIDRTQYTVYYTAAAENLMPDITVLENEP